MEKLFVIKIGGNIIDDESALAAFLENFSSIKEKKILIHGGGKLATRIAEQTGVPQQMINGRRITDAETLKIIVMVYAGYINKNIVALLQANRCDAAGLTGADGNSITAHKRIHAEIDYGFVGDIDAVNSDFINRFIESGITPVFSPVTHDQKGLLLNTNADTMAQELAAAFAGLYDVSLIYCFEKTGVLMNADDDTTLIKNIDPLNYLELKAKNIISAGMIPKMDNAFAALDKGVQHVVIGKAGNLQQLIHGQSGTAIARRR
jgi:acetylglutamate kinase